MIVEYKHITIQQINGVVGASERDAVQMFLFHIATPSEAEGFDSTCYGGGDGARGVRWERWVDGAKVR